MGYEVDEAQVADFGLYLGAEAGQSLPEIEKLAREEGMSADGFKGVLSKLGEIVTGDASTIVGEGFSLMQVKMCDLGDAVIDAAKSYGYSEDESKSLFERNGLGGDNGEDITFGKGYGDDGYDRHTEGGSSKYNVTELDIKAIDRPDSTFADDVDAGAVLDVVNWIWSEFGVDGGKSFTDSILEPLAGNPNSIKANGQAWVSVGGNFGLLASNIVDNAAKLAADGWEHGDAADAFREFLSQYWQDGAVWAGEKLGEFISKGFEKVAEVSISIAQLAVDAINKILKLAGKIAARFIPWVGWAWTAIEYAAKAASYIPGVDLDIDALHDNIMEIIDLAQKVFSLYESLEQVVETMQDYFNTAQDLVDTVKQIPEIGNLQDAASTYESIKDNAGKLKEQTGALEQNIEDASGKLSELDGIAEDAGN